MTQRAITATFLIAGALLLIYFGGFALIITTVICLMFALYEEYQALSRAGHQPVAWPTWAALVLSVPLAACFGEKVVIPILMSAFLVTAGCVIFRAQPQLDDLVMSLLPLFSVVLPGFAVISLSHVQPLSVQRTLLGLLIAVPVSCDSLAFFVGTRMKGPHLCTQVSPHKTISGAVGGLVGAVAAAMLIGLIARLICAPTTWPLLPHWWQYLLIGLTGGAASQLGDLFASLIKRHCGIKDFSNLFPGHGGMLDRLDSIVFMAIVVMCFRLLTA